MTTLLIDYCCVLCDHCIDATVSCHRWSRMDAGSHAMHELACPWIAQRWSTLPLVFLRVSVAIQLLRISQLKIDVPVDRIGDLERLDELRPGTAIFHPAPKFTRDEHLGWLGAMLVAKSAAFCDHRSTKWMGDTRNLSKSGYLALACFSWWVDSFSI